MPQKIFKPLIPSDLDLYFGQQVMALQQKNTTKIFGPRPVFAGQLYVSETGRCKIGAHEMKKLFYRLSSSRSFAKLFSMYARLEERRGVTMSYRKLISAVIIAAFGFYFSGEARARVL